MRVIFYKHVTLGYRYPCIIQMHTIAVCTLCTYLQNFMSCTVNFKGAWSDFPKGSWFFIQMMRHRPRNCGFKFQLNWSNCLVTWRDYIYCNCLHLTVLPQLVIFLLYCNIFQTVLFSAVKFSRGYDKNMSFPLIPKPLKIWIKKKKIWSNWLG